MSHEWKAPEVLYGKPASEIEAKPAPSWWAANWPDVVALVGVFVVAVVGLGIAGQLP